MIWSDWWVWAVAAVALGILEVLLPGFILLGFAIGAGLVALNFLIGGPLALWLTSSLPLTLLVFALLSVVAWIALRRVFGVREGQIKTFDHDIND
jgi:membrane protein implicated in regulation of membrane protease activity